MIVETIRTLDEFQNLREDWNRLLVKSASNGICLTWEWMFTWWKHYRTEKSLFIIKISNDDGSLLGLAPLCITNEHVYHIATLKVLSFLGSGEVCSDYLDFIICKEGHNEVLRVLLKHIKTHSNLWHFAVLNDISESSPNYKMILEVLKSQKSDFLINTSTTCPYIELPDTYEAYTQSLSKNMRYNLRRKTRDIEKKFNARFAILKPSDSIEKAMAHLVNLHKKRRKMIGAESNFIRDRMLAFHDDIARIFHRQGILRIYTLDIKGEPVAIIYGFRYCGTFYDYQTGMDPEFAKHSVGTVLIGHCIRDSIENGLKVFDFMRGSESYKLRWAKKSIKTLDIILTSPKSHRGQSYVAARSLLRRVKKLAKTDFPLKGLKKKDD